MHNNPGNDARHWNLTRYPLRVTKKTRLPTAQTHVSKRNRRPHIAIRICCVSINELLLTQGHKIFTEVRCASRGTECLSFDVLSPIDSLCIGHFSTMNLEIKHRERHLCLDHQHRQETQGSTWATAATEIKRTQEPWKTPPTIQRDTHQDQR